VALPVVRAQWVRPILLANLVGEIVIIVTGGIVRLTGSGLGCPDWPTCASGSLTPVAAQAEGFHKFIEFGNRTLTGGLIALAVLALWTVKTHFPDRKALHRLGWLMIGGILAEVVVGGITVLTGLNPTIVAFHFLITLVLIAAAAAMVRGAEDEHPGARTLLVHPLAGRLAWATFVVGGVIMVLGTIVTGSGPHSGDAIHPTRTGFDPRLVSWIHADVVMLFVGLALAVFVAVKIAHGAPDASRPELDRASRTWHTVLIVTALQGVIGYVQYFTSLPVVLVGTHMLGSALLTLALTNGTLNLYRNPV
jgi:cytochrome c oxidase assembly protein subunit 15